MLLIRAGWRVGCRNVRVCDVRVFVRVWMRYACWRETFRTYLTKVCTLLTQAPGQAGGLGAEMYVCGGYACGERFFRLNRHRCVCCWRVGCRNVRVCDVRVFVRVWMRYACWRETPYISHTQMCSVLTLGGWRVGWDVDRAQPFATRGSETLWFHDSSSVALQVRSQCVCVCVCV